MCSPERKNPAPMGLKIKSIDPRKAPQMVYVTLSLEPGDLGITSSSYRTESSTVFTGQCTLPVGFDSINIHSTKCPPVTIALDAGTGPNIPDRVFRTKNAITPLLQKLYSASKGCVPTVDNAVRHDVRSVDTKKGYDLDNGLKREFYSDAYINSIMNENIFNYKTFRTDDKNNLPFRQCPIIVQSCLKSKKKNINKDSSELLSQMIALHEILGETIDQLASEGLPAPGRRRRDAIMEQAVGGCVELTAEERKLMEEVLALSEKINDVNESGVPENCCGIKEKHAHGQINGIPITATINEGKVVKKKKTKRCLSSCCTKKKPGSKSPSKAASKSSCSSCCDKKQPKEDLYAYAPPEEEPPIIVERPTTSNDKSTQTYRSDINIPHQETIIPPTPPIRSPRNNKNTEASMESMYKCPIGKCELPKINTCPFGKCEEARAQNLGPINITTFDSHHDKKHVTTKYDSPVSSYISSEQSTKPMTHSVGVETCEPCGMVVRSIGVGGTIRNNDTDGYNKTKIRGLNPPADEDNRTSDITNSFESEPRNNSESTITTPPIVFEKISRSNEGNQIIHEPTNSNDTSSQIPERDQSALGQNSFQVPTTELRRCTPCGKLKGPDNPDRLKKNRIRSGGSSARSYDVAHRAGPDHAKLQDEFGINRIIQSAQPPSCTRRALLNEENFGSVPYAASFNSLPLDEEDIEYIRSKIDRDTKLKSNRNAPQIFDRSGKPEFQYFTRLDEQDKDANSNSYNAPTIAQERQRPNAGMASPTRYIDDSSKNTTVHKPYEKINVKSEKKSKLDILKYILEQLSRNNTALISENTNLRSQLVGYNKKLVEKSQNPEGTKTKLAVGMPARENSTPQSDKNEIPENMVPENGNIANRFKDSELPTKIEQNIEQGKKQSGNDQNSCTTDHTLKTTSHGEKDFNEFSKKLQSILHKQAEKSQTSNASKFGKNRPMSCESIWSDGSGSVFFKEVDKDKIANMKRPPKLLWKLAKLKYNCDGTKSFEFVDKKDIPENCAIVPALDNPDYWDRTDQIEENGSSIFDKSSSFLRLR